MTNKTPPNDTPNNGECRGRLELSKAQQKALGGMIKILEAILRIDGNMPLHYVLMWLLVSRSAAKGQTLKALTLAVKTSKATTERFKAKFMELGLIEIIDDRVEDRSYLYKISKKGRIKLNQLEVIATTFETAT
ncbi:MAG: hypothetical protein COC24_011780 [Alphaproteobacteria bacterium]|nr:hypothetical protein [Alphaproteobacteria bacterium]